MFGKTDIMMLRLTVMTLVIYALSARMAIHMALVHTVKNHNRVLGVRHSFVPRRRTGY